MTLPARILLRLATWLIDVATRRVPTAQLGFALALAKRAGSDDEVLSWALSAPDVAFRWITSGYVLESRLPDIVERALSAAEEAERVERESDTRLN